MKSVGIVIPAYNEQNRIVATLQAVKSIAGVAKIMLVDDGSSDATVCLARAEGVYVLELEQNRGKGGAMNAALPYIDTEIVVFLDADLGESAKQAELLIKPVKDGITDLCIAAFPPPRKKGGFGLVKGTAAWALRKVGNINATAPLSGQRAMTRAVLQAVTPFNEGYGVELGMTITALKKGFRVMEVPTTMSHQETGRDIRGFMHRGKQFIDVLKVLADLFGDIARATVSK